MAQSIPVIDMRVAESDPARFAAELGAGFREVGFVGLTHHGVSSELVEGAYDTFRSFFALPVETKRAYTPPKIKHESWRSPPGRPPGQGVRL